MSVSALITSAKAVGFDPLGFVQTEVEEPCLECPQLLNAFNPALDTAATANCDRLEGTSGRSWENQSLVISALKGGPKVPLIGDPLKGR